jgi:hypothetical protein
MVFGVKEQDATISNTAEWLHNDQKVIFVISQKSKMAATTSKRHISASRAATK